MQTPVDEIQLKALFKSALVEVMEERRDLIRDAVEEALEDIQKYQAGRKEIEMIAMLDAPLDSIEKSIDEKNPEAFKRNFIALTNTCNTCHIAVDFGFNVIKIPDASPFGNQDFTPLNNNDHSYLEKHTHLEDELNE